VSVSTRQKVKSARNRADPYIRLLLGTRPKNMIHMPGDGESSEAWAPCYIGFLPGSPPHVLSWSQPGFCFWQASVYALMWPKPVVPFGQKVLTAVADSRVQKPRCPRPR
jgi:hypothetical protein